MGQRLGWGNLRDGKVPSFIFPISNSNVYNTSNKMKEGTMAKRKSFPYVWMNILHFFFGLFPFLHNVDTFALLFKYPPPRLPISSNYIYNIKGTHKGWAGLVISYFMEKT